MSYPIKVYSARWRSDCGAAEVSDTAVANRCHLVALDEYVRNRSVCICGWRSNVYPRETVAIKAGMSHIKYGVKARR